jgi:hypothetical protein
MYFGDFTDIKAISQLFPNFKSTDSIGDIKGFKTVMKPVLHRSS